MIKSIARHQEGATLIEVLIAIVVLSIGLLGLAGLQATSVQSNHSAYQRSQATLLGYDLADRMRAQPHRGTDQRLRNRNISHVLQQQCCDRYTEQQKTKLNGSITWPAARPNGTGRVQKTGNLVTIEVRWNDNRGRIAKSDAVADADTIFTYRTEI